MGLSGGAAVVRAVLGDALFAVRLLPALLGAAIVGLTGLLTRAFGGGRVAILLAGLCMLIAPVFLRTHTLFQPVSFDQFYWLLGAYVLVRWIQSGDDRWWLGFGVVAGLGLLNKYTMLLFGAGVFIGLYFFFSERARRYRLLGWMYVVAFVVLLVFQGKSYYLTPVVPMLMAAGAVVVVRWTARRRHRRAWQGAIAGLLVVTGAALAPIGLPMLSPPQMARYMWLMGLAQTVETEQLDQLPQDFADMFGWEEKVARVAAVYRRLPPEEQAEAVILAGNYGQAGAIDLFGPAYDLPKAVSPSSSYYLWGPGEKPGTVAVALGIPRDVLERYYAEVEQAAIATHPYALPAERDVPVYVARRPAQTLQQVWPDLHPFR